MHRVRFSQPPGSVTIEVVKTTERSISEPFNGVGVTRREVLVLGSLSFRVRRCNVKGACSDDCTSWDRDRFSGETANTRGVKVPTFRRQTTAEGDLKFMRKRIDI
jgi:hypothetical protein